MRARPGTPPPLGATWDGQGTNFALYSKHATAVELCLCADGPAASQTDIVPVTHRADGVWHIYVPGIAPGQRYGYRLHGPYAPRDGHRFNPAKLVTDPHGRAVSGHLRWHDAVYGYHPDDPNGSRRDDRDSAPYVPRSVVIDPRFDWGDDAPPRTSWDRTIVYEAHVKGLTYRHPDVPPELRGTYLALVTDPILDHLHALGVTALQLLPIHHAISERRLADRGLVNYWGYNTLSYFAPDARFAAGDDGRQVHEFKTMVKGLHAAGIEVLLDVVYNHTAESGHRGPTLCLRGVDNRSYYLLRDDDRGRYRDYAGTGNTLDMSRPAGRRLVMDSLRYWAGEMRVDGFRFDLAPALARGFAPEDGFESVFEAIRDDPLLRETKLIAEPWDAGEGGYRVGQFPPGWAEWNGPYRDAQRRFWRGDRGRLAEWAQRFTGSSDLYSGGDRGPLASVNFVTCHDGLTLHDLVSYERKHNEANGEANRDGTDANWSDNCGVEGPTDRADVVSTRDRIKRNLLATLALSHGVPMLSHGDELGRSQQGNNNAYCQDNDVTWIDWERRDDALLTFTRAVFTIRRHNPVFRRRTFLRGRSEAGADVMWLREDGLEMTDSDWTDKRSVCGVWLPREGSDQRDAAAAPAAARTVLLIVNAGPTARRFAIPSPDGLGKWTVTIDTAGNPVPAHLGEPPRSIAARSLVLLEWTPRAP